MNGLLEMLVEITRTQADELIDLQNKVGYARQEFEGENDDE